MKTYREVQAYKARAGVIIIGLVAALLGYGVVQQVVLGKPFGNQPMPSGGLVIGFIILLVIGILLYQMKLYTTINQEGIYVKLFPLQIQWRHIPWKEVEGLELVQFNAMKDYGGYGIRWKLNGKEKALIIAGEHGLRVKRSGRKALVIGTQQLSEMESRMEEWLEKSKS